MRSLLASLILVALSAGAVADDRALHDAVRAGSPVQIREALDAGADIHGVDSSGFSPLLSACLCGQSEVVVALLAHGADPNRSNLDGATPLMAAAIKGDLEIAKLLLAAGADPGARNVAGATAWTKAEEYGHAELTDYLSGLTLRSAQPPQRPDAGPAAPGPASAAGAPRSRAPSGPGDRGSATATR